MKTNKAIYFSICSIVILLTVVLFAHNFHFCNVPNVAALIFISVVFVHLVKALRLYIALYGTGISLANYVKTYCKVTFVNMVIPYKLGEIFRIYCYGYEIKNYLRSFVIILLDRFMDTIALLTFILCILSFRGMFVSKFIYFILLFTLFTVAIYFSFPGIYGFWNKYLLSSNSSKQKVFVLEILHKLNVLYIEISNIVKGRGFILYLLSLVAWLIEVGNIALISKILDNNNNLNNQISSFLVSAFNNQPNILLNYVITSSILLLIAVYVFFKLKNIFKQSKENYENNCSIR